MKKVSVSQFMELVNLTRLDLICNGLAEVRCTLRLTKKGKKVWKKLNGR